MLEDITKDLASYLSWRVKRDRFEVEVKDKAVAQRMNRMGFPMVLYWDELGWEEVLAWSRKRDEIERMFRQIKTDIEVRPLRAHKTDVVKGWILVTFISLILRSRLTRMLNEAGLAEKYSTPSLVLELGKLNRMELTDGSFITTEVTKRQRGILEKLGTTLYGHMPKRREFKLERLSKSFPTIYFPNFGYYIRRNKGLKIKNQFIYYFIEFT